MELNQSNQYLVCFDYFMNLLRKGEEGEGKEKPQRGKGRNLVGAVGHG